MTLAFKWFQHTAARRRLVVADLLIVIYGEFQHTAARRRLVWATEELKSMVDVSTHSRPKAAGLLGHCIETRC